MATIGLNGFELYYEVQGSGRPVIFAHGVGGNHAHWFNQAAFFSEYYQVVVFDHRGFGNSRDPGGPGRSRFVEDLRALMDHLGLEKATLVAQSMGGGTCVGFTAAYPERVEALVLADTVTGLELPEPIASAYAKILEAAESLGQLERVLGEGTRTNNRALAQLYAAMTSFNMVNRHTVAGSFGSGCSPEQLAATGVPILWLVGTEDVLATPRIVSAVHSLTPGSRFIEVPAAGHSVYFEAPDQFNAAVVDFLRTCGVR